MDMEEMLNFNIGMLGHVDSGKTSLAKALSTVSSTAAFDKNPQSKERGITLDLGFSSFVVDLPDHLDGCCTKHLQYTLVDCPGHASLIRTIIGGAQIIDLMVLVIDVTKGMQTQTAECLVIGEVVCSKMLVVLNKIDLLPDHKRETSIEKMTKRMVKTLENTKFAGSAIVAVSANPGGSQDDDEPAAKRDPEGIQQLITELKAHTYVPRRTSSGDFVFTVDHCFSIRGQGTVMTGTVLSGKINVGDSVEIAHLQTVKKVKSIQMFRQPRPSIQQGDRAGVCVTQFDPKLLERGLVCTPGALPHLYAALVCIRKIAYYAGAVCTKSKHHVTIGYDTVMAKVAIFGDERVEGQPINVSAEQLTLEEEKGFDFGRDYAHQDQLEKECVRQWALLEFERAVICRPNSLVIGSRLDADVNTSKCRLAFCARIVHPITDKEYCSSLLPSLRVFKVKRREGTVERMHDERTVICRGLVKKESNLDLFLGLKVSLSSGEQGVIDRSFGLSGKIKLIVPDGLRSETQDLLTSRGTKKRGRTTPVTNSSDSQITATVIFKRYVFDPSKRMAQT